MRGRDQIPRGRGSARDGSHRRVVTLETTPSGRAPIDARVDRVPRATSRDAAHTSTFRHVRVRAIRLHRRRRVRARCERRARRERARERGRRGCVSRAIEDIERAYRARSDATRASRTGVRGGFRWKGNSLMVSRRRGAGWWTDRRAFVGRSTQASGAKGSKARARDRVPRELAADVVPGYGRSGAPQG